MKIIKLIILIAGCSGFLSCKKDSLKPQPLNSLTVTNVIIGGSVAKIGSNTTTINNNNSAKFTFLTGENLLYVFPQTDSLKPYYNNTLTCRGGDMYSLFICGRLNTVESILIKDDIPAQNASTAGIRFINLSPNSAPLTITQTISPTLNEVSNLGYKQYTEFKTYVPGAATSYSFQIRNSGDNSVLANYTLAPVPRSANVTLVIRGLMNGSPGLGVTKVNSDRP